MPRKSASHAAKKDAAAVDTKSEGGAPRRSGRAVAKPEVVSEVKSEKREASRSRRSSTAAQTAASVAESKSPKSRNSVSSRRDSSSPSEERPRSGRGGAESPAVRVKSARRNASRINYKESDGEEEAPTPKNDENFESNEEFEESESDEKSKPKGRGKVSRSPAKVIGGAKKGKSRASGGRSRRGRPAKKKYEDEDSEPETFDVSEESIDADAPSVAHKTAKVPAKVKETPSKRGKKAKAVPEVTEEKAKSKPSRRSARAPVSKDDVPKRPSRSVQAKRYTEEDEDDIEELSDSKTGEGDEDAKAEPESGSSRKRKRNAAPEPNKRLKEDDASEDKPSKEEEEEEVEEEEEEEEDECVDSDKKDVAEGSKKKTETEKKKETIEKPSDEKVEEDSEEAMEVDESDSPVKSEKSLKITKDDDKMDDSTSEDKVVESKKEQDSSIAKDNKTPVVDTSQESENFEDSASDSEPGSRADQSISSGLDDSQESHEEKKDKVVDNAVEKSEVDNKPAVSEPSSGSFDSLLKTGDSLKESKSPQPTVTVKAVDGTTESSKPESNKVVSSEPVVNSNVSPGSTTLTSTLHSKEQNPDSSFNGGEKPAPPATNTTHVIHSSSVIFEHKESPAPKANGAPDILHNNAVPSHEQNVYPFPGRKYVINSKLSENIRKSAKDKTFSFLSYNMGATSPDTGIPKDKLLHELDKLQSHIICLQQVAKPFYNEVLEPSLDALGFKGVFSQLEESSKGLATFYKSSLFRIFRHSEASLKKCIDKDLETSTMDANDKIAVKTHLKKCGSALFTQFNSVIGDHKLTVANVQIPSSELSTQALQVSCLAREVLSMAEGANKALVLCGEFNMTEGEAPYQLLRDGYLSNEMIEELQKRKDVALPGKENAALINLLWKAFQHPSSNLCSSYASVLDHELFIPEKKTTSPDLLWYSSDSLHTVGVLDVVSDKPGECHFSLKADIAFSV